MSTHSLIRIAGIVGGLSWLGQAAVNQYEAAGTAVNALYYGGAVLIVVAVVGLAGGLVSAAAWLKLVVGLCFPILVWAVLEVLREQTSDNIVDGGFGLALALICAASLLGGADKEEQGVRRGSHAK